MFLPYETTVNLWFSASPVYRWEPVAPAVEPEAGTGAPVGSAAQPDDSEIVPSTSCKPLGLPAMRLVFKGLKWTAYPVYGIRENLGWNEASATLRQIDEQKCDDERHEAHKAPARPQQPKPSR